MKYVDQIVGGVIYSLGTRGGGLILPLKRGSFTFNMGRVLKPIN
jgi:hypothetical protein